MPDFFETEAAARRELEAATNKAASRLEDSLTKARAAFDETVAKAQESFDRAQLEASQAHSARLEEALSALVAEANTAAGLGEPSDSGDQTPKGRLRQILVG
jgi:F0F1-type ATP synthase membrane subunit b/b'